MFSHSLPRCGTAGWCSLFGASIIIAQSLLTGYWQNKEIQDKMDNDFVKSNLFALPDFGFCGYMWRKDGIFYYINKRF